MRETHDMGINDDAFGDAKGISEDDIGRLACDSGESVERLHSIRHFPFVFFSNDLAGGFDASRLVVVKVNFTNIAIEFFYVG